MVYFIFNTVTGDIKDSQIFNNDKEMKELYSRIKDQRTYKMYSLPESELVKMKDVLGNKK